jgi:hypothetical protein
MTTMKPDRRTFWVCGAVACLLGGGVALTTTLAQQQPPAPADSPNAPSITPSIAPSTQPADADAGARGGADALAAPGDVRRGGPMRGAGPGGSASAAAADQPLQPPATPEETHDAEVWAKQMFPVRYAFYDLVPEGRPAKRQMTQNMVRHYRLFRRIQEQQPDLYDFMIKQEQLRDQALGLARDARRGNADAESKLRETVTQIYDLNIQEREARIERLKKNLDSMESQLSTDREQRDQKITEQIRKLQDEAGRGPGGRRGAGATTRKSE